MGTGTGSVDRKTLLHTGLASRAVAGRTAPRAWSCRAVARDRESQREPQQVTLGARPITVGAHRDCDLVLDDPQVSRRHAELQVTDGGVRIRDLGSTNGTLWRGSRIAEVVLPPDASVQIGAFTLRIAPVEALSLPPSSRHRFGGLVGRSAAMRELFAVLELASPTDATVLIEGESGTGKEVAARAIHDHSPRAAEPFVVVDCSAVSDQLIDSHLFGHVRGAFTGAASDRQGAFVAAGGGTVFLDELGELPLSLQAKLLRVLEARTVQPVGADRTVEIGARVVAATHRDLSRMVAEQRFRFDLFYRLAVVHVHIPPLADRPEDIPALIRHFYEGRGVDPGPLDGEGDGQGGGDSDDGSAGAGAGANLDQLMRHGWPGNVRELRNVLERAWALTPAGAPFSALRLWVHTTPREGGPDPIDTSLPFKDAKERWIELFEQRYLAGVFAAHGGNITHAAAHAGINRRHMRTLLRKYGLVE